MVAQITVITGRKIPVNQEKTFFQQWGTVIMVHTHSRSFALNDTLFVAQIAAMFLVNGFLQRKSEIPCHRFVADRSCRDAVRPAQAQATAAAAPVGARTRTVRVWLLFFNALLSHLTCLCVPRRPAELSSRSKRRIRTAVALPRRRNERCLLHRCSAGQVLN